MLRDLRQTGNKSRGRVFRQAGESKTAIAGRRPTPQAISWRRG